LDTLENALSATVENQNDISEFLNTPPQKDHAASEADIAAQHPPVTEKRPRGRPPGTGKHQKAAKRVAKRAPEQSYIPEGEIHQNAPEASQSASTAEDVQRGNAALAAVGLIETSGYMIAEEGARMTPGERENMHENFERYFAAKGISDFPPGVALALCVGGYYFRVMATERARPRVALAWAWVKAKFSGLRRKPAPVKDGA